MTKCVLIAPVTAVRPDPGNEKPAIAVLPAGSVVTVAGEPRESGLIDVICENECFTVFFQDLQERATAGSSAGSNH